MERHLIGLQRLAVPVPGEIVGHRAPAGLVRGFAPGFDDDGGVRIEGTDLPRGELARRVGREETEAALDAAVALAGRGTPSPEQLESLGGGGLSTGGGLSGQ